MYFPIHINWMSPFPISGLLGGIFHFYSNFERLFCKQTVENLIRCCVLWQANSKEPDQMPCFAASDLVLHCLPMPHKKVARLIWVKKT